MINSQEFRLNNFLLQKINTRISMVRCGPEQLSLIASGNLKDFFPVQLTPELFLKAGFIENKDYPLLPDAREFKLVIPVLTDNATEIQGYVKNNKECFARSAVNKFIASNPVYHLHQLQNLFFALTGEELPVKI
jgi:hypothetical protein